MIDMFLYNWQIREEWFEWCENLSTEELVKKRTGGRGSILHNLYHVIDCEQLWVNQMQGTAIIENDMLNITTLNDVKAFSDLTKPVTLNFFKSYNTENNDKVLVLKRKDGSTKSLSHEKVLTHIFTHEIHHMGQLSVWSRDIGLKPVSSDLVFRELV